MKFYKKKGNRNYKERRLISQLEKAFEKRRQQDADFDSKIIPATNFDELKTMHSKYATEDVEYVSENNTETQNTNMKTDDNIEDAKVVETIEDEPTPKSDSSQKTETNQFIDPFNREEPIVRDYVFGDDSMSKGGVKNEPSQTVFDEPTNFTEAFEIPDDEEEEETKSSSSKGSSEKPKMSEPLNPNFDDMSAGKKRKSTKRFAKYIVEAVSTLSEKGFVWYANQDINDAKLAEYEMTGEMDLSLLVSLEDGQEVTVKQFFQVQCAKAEQLSQWTQEQKDDLTAALTEVLLEKGVAPTPTQELLLVTLTIVGGQAMTLLTLKSQTNSLLEQLRAMNGGNQSFETNYTEPPATPQPVTEVEEPEPVDTVEEAENQIAQDDSEMFNELANLTEQQILMGSDTVETKE